MWLLKKKIKYPQRQPQAAYHYTSTVIHHKKIIRILYYCRSIFFPFLFSLQNTRVCHITIIYFFVEASTAYIVIIRVYKKRDDLVTCSRHRPMTTTTIIIIIIIIVRLKDHCCSIQSPPGVVECTCDFSIVGSLRWYLYIYIHFNISIPIFYMCMYIVYI